MAYTQKIYEAGHDDLYYRVTSQKHFEYAQKLVEERNIEWFERKKHTDAKGYYLVFCYDHDDATSPALILRFHNGNRRADFMKWMETGECEWLEKRKMTTAPESKGGVI